MLKAWNQAARRVEITSMGKEIRIIVNGLEERVPENATISFLVTYFREDDIHLMVEHNGRFVYPKQYESTVVAEGDWVEFINPNFGG